MLPWIELQQIKAYWLQHHAISHTQLHLLFFFFFDKSEKRNIISTTWKLLYVILFTVFVKDFIFHPLGSSLSLRILFQLTSHLFYSGFLGYHEHIFHLINSFSFLDVTLLQVVPLVSRLLAHSHVHGTAQQPCPMQSLHN